MKTYIAVFEASDDWKPTMTIKDSCVATGIAKGVELKKIQAKRLVEVSPDTLNQILNGESKKG